MGKERERDNGDYRNMVMTHRSERCIGKGKEMENLRVYRKSGARVLLKFKSFTISLSPTALLTSPGKTVLGLNLLKHVLHPKRVIKSTYPIR